METKKNSNHPSRMKLGVPKNCGSSLSSHGDMYLDRKSGDALSAAQSLAALVLACEIRSLSVEQSEVQANHYGLT